MFERLNISPQKDESEDDVQSDADREAIIQRAAEAVTLDNDSADTEGEAQNDSLENGSFQRELQKKIADGAKHELRSVSNPHGLTEMEDWA